jgi:enoyl-CoA hydratase/carnithine racemase
MPMMLTGKSYDAKRGKKIGLVDMVVEPIGKVSSLQCRQ